jgi:hypothetical protein
MSFAACFLILPVLGLLRTFWLIAFNVAVFGMKLGLAAICQNLICACSQFLFLNCTEVRMLPLR